MRKIILMALVAFSANVFAADPAPTSQPKKECLELIRADLDKVRTDTATQITRYDVAGNNIIEQGFVRCGHEILTALELVREWKPLESDFQVGLISNICTVNKDMSTAVLYDDCQ